MVYAYDSFIVLIAVGAIFTIGTVLMNRSKRVKMPKDKKDE